MKARRGKQHDLSARYPPLEVLDCRYGKMLTFRNDEVIGRSLRLYGEWAQHELSYLRRFVIAGRDVVDVGANIGTHTIAFSKWVGSGRVIALEPQSFVASVLEANCALNDLRNVEIVRAACGSRASRATYFQDHKNVGATALKFRSALKKVVLELFSNKEDDAASVSVCTLDEVLADRPVSLIKIDVEGMELEVVKGAMRVLRNWHPVVYFEQNNTKQLAQISEMLKGLNYRLFWLETHQFNQDNFRRETENVWWRTETGVLAFHDSSIVPSELIEVRSDRDDIPTRQDARVGILVPPIP